VRLTEAVATAVADGKSAPAAVLALTYAERIDEATHTTLGLAKALQVVRTTVDAAGSDEARDALDKVCAAVSAVTVASDLGPKLLAALDALLLTPKARAAVGQAVTDTAPASPLAALRAEEDELASRRARHTG
jgi:hypothetical protein